MSDLIEAMRNRIALLKGQDMMPDLVRELEVAAHLIEQQQARIAELEQREQELAATVERLREIANAVAHIGVDFGYGKCELEQKHIDAARELLKGGSE